MEDSLLSEFEQLKISALSKYSLLKFGFDNNVTIGPNSIKSDKQKPILENNVEKVNANKKVEQHTDSKIIDLIKHNEIQRTREVKNNVRNHIENIEKFSQQNQAYHKEKWLLAQEDFIKYQREKELLILQANDEFDRHISNEHAKIKKQYSDMEEQRKLRQHQLKQAEEYKKALHLNIEKIMKYHQEFRLVYQLITTTIQKCTDRDKLRKNLGDKYEQLKTLPSQIEEVRNKCKSATSITDLDVKNCSEIVSNLRTLCNNIKEFVEDINNVQTNNQSEPPKPSTPTSVNNQQIAVQPPKVDKTENRTETRTKISESTEQFNMSKYISLNNFKIYCEIMSFLKTHSESFQDLEKDSTLKQFKFDCKKAVKTPVNSLSGVNSEHILDKYKRLHSLLKGENVIMNNKAINASKHPQGIAFCMDILAKSLVLQGDLMVSSNPESAFCYASLILSLWNEFPTFGNLILGYFYTYCPCLMPYYIPREVDETDEEFYKKCGYQYVDGQIETQDKFLKRLTGIARLYFALFIAKPKRGQNNVPINLCHGWRWLSSILKLEPQVDVTATVLHTFLETVGFEMETRYGKMFFKMLHIIQGPFLQVCKKKCTGGAGTRLELLLNEHMKTNKFAQPPGYSPVSTW